MLKLYGNAKSGNVYKVSLLLHLLNREYEEVQVGLGPGSDAESLEFRAINPLGQIPVLEAEDGTVIAQSNAILFYLAKQTPFFPESAEQQAMVMQWLFFEQYELEPNLAWSRWICYLMNRKEEMADELEKYHRAGYRALDTVEAELLRRPHIASTEASIADIALFAYIHNCHQGGFSLENYPAIQGWIERIRSLKGFFSMEAQFSRFDYV